MASFRPHGFAWNSERAHELREDAKGFAIVSVIAALCTGIAILVFAFVISTRSAGAEEFDHRYPQIEQQSYSAPSHRHAHRSHHAYRAARPTLDANGSPGRGLVTVPTAAGINITVSQSFAPKIVPFIAALVARGYHPSKIHCYNLSRSHVPGSLHFSGNACDFAQRGWGKTDRPMYHVADLARQYGVRDGCTFSDCGHIDSGQQLARRHPFLGAAYSARSHRHRHHHRRYASR